MEGKRTEKSIWSRKRLLPLLALLAAVCLLPPAKLAADAAQAGPPVEEVQPPPGPEADTPPEVVPEEPPVPEEPQLPPKDLPLDPDKPMIALTFDDGPDLHTDRLLDLFDRYGGKATFFVVGRNISGYEAVVKRAAEEGHEVGSHSWSHPQLTKLTQAGIKEQMTRTADKLLEVTGVTPTLLRPPYGDQNKTVRRIAGELGFALVHWNVDPRDWELKDADKVYDAVMASAQDGAIILCHDIHGTTVDAMERLIPELRIAGYQLVTVTELLTARGGELVPGTQYRYRPEPVETPPEPEAAPEQAPPAAPAPAAPAAPVPAPSAPAVSNPAPAA